MLRGIDPLISPDLLTALAEMGHGDVLALVDRNFPAHSTGRRVVRLDGTNLTEAARAILALLPIDAATGPGVGVPLRYMADPSSDAPAPVHAEVIALAEAAEGRTVPAAGLPRFDFYAAASQAYVTVVTGETRRFGNVLIAKGTILD
jgi:L-fucose mutarotase